MSSRRSRSFAFCLAFATLVAAGCGGGQKAHDQDRPAERGAAPPPSTPPPIFDVDHVSSSLLPAKDVAKGAKLQAPTFPGLTESAVPTCSASSLHLPGRPKTLARQLRVISKHARFTGTAYIQLVAVYPDAAAASAAMAAVRAKAAACPAKRHFPGKRRGARKIVIAHTDTWKSTEDTVAGWPHVRGFEKHEDPPSVSKYNVFYDIYDYAVRGNVLMASLYWERVAPTVPGDQIAKRATDVLTKQLRKIG